MLIFSDDAAYSDFGFSAALNGIATDMETPSLDRLAQQGVVASQAYVAGPLCSPCRAGLLSGQYQQRYGYEENIANSLAAAGTMGLRQEQITIAQRLKPLGYTTGVIGKWHEGYYDGLNRPLDKGFDEFYGLLGGSRSYWTQSTPEQGIWKNDRFYESQYRVEGDPSKYDPVNGRYVTDAFGEEAVDFINRHAGDENPFFLYLAFTAPHIPHHAKQADLDHFAHISDPTERAIAAMTYAMDRSIGEVLDALDANGIDENTIVVFTNDNGADWMIGNPPFFGHKGTTYEGGIRVPFVIKGPGLEPGVYDGPVTALDFLPTFVAAAGGDVSQIPTDGYDVMPLLTGAETNDPHEVMIWRNFNTWAVRKGDWKLTLPYQGAPSINLFNIALDPTENSYYGTAHPDVVADLSRELTYWEAQMAKPEWGPLGAHNQNLFDHFVFRNDQAAVTNWSTAGAWLESGTTTAVNLKPADAHANATLEFTVRNDGDFTATNDMTRLSTLTFMLNQFRLTGDFSGAANRQGTINGNAVLLVKDLSGQLPQIRLDATSTASPASFAFHIDNELQLLDDLEITGDGTEDFVINGRIVDYYQPQYALPTVPCDVTKTGTSHVTLTGHNTFGGTLTVSGGGVTLSGASAAIDGIEAIVIGSSGRFTLASGTVAAHTLDNSAGGEFHFNGGFFKVVEVRGTLVNDGGTFAPGASPARSTISGDFVQQAGMLQIELGGPSASQSDTLIVGGSALLSAALDVDLVNGFVPDIGYALQILIAGEGAFGTFDNTLLPTLPNGASWSLLYGANSIALFVGPAGAVSDMLPGDYNQDGFVDAADYTVWRDTLGSSVVSGTGADGDFDGQITVADFGAWKSMFGFISIGDRLRGDYNEDGIVDAADYTVWRDTLGNTVARGTGADGDFDGQVTAADFNVWKSMFGSVSISDRLRGDYNEDGVVDAADYTVWRDTLGSTVTKGTGADGDFDGRVTAADFNVWKALFGRTSGAKGSTAAVPEPAALVLLVCGGMGAVAMRRRWIGRSAGTARWPC